MKDVDISDIKRIFSKNIDNIISMSDYGSYNHHLDYGEKRFMVRETSGKIRKLTIRKKGFLNNFSGVELGYEDIDIRSFKDIFEELKSRRECKRRKEKEEEIKEIMK